MATMLAKVLEIERHQVADYARVDYAIKKGEDEITALEDLGLRVCPKTSGGITKFSEHEAD
jgi:hypothetical protein